MKIDCSGPEQSKHTSRRLCFCFLEENWKYQMPVWTEDLDQAVAENIGTFDGVKEISVGLTEDVVIIFKGSIGYGKSLLFQCPVSTWHMQCVKRGSVGNTRLFYQNAACSSEFFSPAGRLRLSKCALFLPLVWYWEVVTRIFIFCSLFLVGMIFPQMRVESIFFNLF